MGRKALSGTVKTWNTFVMEEVASVCHEYSEFYNPWSTMVFRTVLVRNVFSTACLMEKQRFS